MTAILKFVYKCYPNSSVFTTLTNFKLISIDIRNLGLEINLSVNYFYRDVTNFE